jgi:hypothetical protein
LDAPPGSVFTLNTGYATITLLDALDTPATLVDAGVLVAQRINEAPELMGVFNASVDVSGPTVQIVVTYPLGAGTNALIFGSEGCESVWSELTPQAVEFASATGMPFACPYPAPNDVANHTARFLCCPIPCAQEGVESYAEIRIWIECLSETPGTLSVIPVGDVCPPPPGGDNLTLVFEIGEDLPPYTGATIMVEGNPECGTVAEQPKVWDPGIHATVEDYAAAWPLDYTFAPYCTVVGRVITFDLAAYSVDFPAPPGSPCPVFCFRYNWFPPAAPEDTNQPPEHYAPYWTILQQPVCSEPLGCGDFVPVAPNPASTDAVIAQLQADYPTAIISREGLDLIVFRIPIEAEADCTAGWQVCASGEIVAHVVQQPACCEPVTPCVPGIDYQPQASTSPVFTEGVGDIFDAVAVFYADCCAPVDGVVVLTNEADGVSLVGLPVVTPLGGNQYSVSQSVEYDGTPIAGTPGEQIDGGTLTFTVECGGADDTAIQIAAIIAEPEDPIPTCPIVIQAANSNRIERVEFSPSGLFSLQARLGMPGCCALPVVSAVVTYEDIPSRLTVLAGGVSNVMVPGSQFFTFQNFQFDSSVATAVPGPYPKLVATAVIAYTCGDSTITRTVNFYLLDPA